MQRVPHLPSYVIFLCDANYDPEDPEYTHFSVTSVVELEGGKLLYCGFL